MTKKKGDNVSVLRAVIRAQQRDIDTLSHSMRERIARDIVGRNGYFIKEEADKMYSWIIKRSK